MNEEQNADRDDSFQLEPEGETESENEPVSPVVAHFEPPMEGLGLDGSTPMEAGIQGRLTHAGGRTESPRNEYDWQVHVDVDQPVQQPVD
jgi:hypothetical protein